MRNDTEHLLSSKRNAARLRKSIRQLCNKTTKEDIPDDWKALLQRML